MEVREPPQGVTPPVQSTTRKSSQQPSRLRKFVLQNSAGLRIRSHPSLQSEQVGIVHVNGTIAFVDEVRVARFFFVGMCDTCLLMAVVFYVLLGVVCCCVSFSELVALRLQHYAFYSSLFCVHVYHCGTGTQQ